MKVQNYKMQDKRAGRVFNNDEYITPQWIMDKYEQQNRECCICRCPFEISLDNGKVKSNITVDRIDNNEAHIIGNWLA